ncbi:hypothetical protein [Tenacibaculum xiamenense]|uniref:hypothetical protein n=1 Tax=Tenacibaculum xiamenense TaxID=1261553 RepID=UPI0038958B99
MEFFKHIQELVVVNILLGSELKFICSSVKKVGDKIRVIDEVLVSGKIHGVIEVSRKKSVILLFNGDKVLYTGNGDLFRSTLNSFYTSKYSSSDDREFLALARKEEVDKIVKNFLDNGLFIIDIQIGSFSIGLFYKKSFFDKEFKTSYLSLVFDDEDCVKVEKISDSLVRTDLDEKKEINIALSSVYNHYYPSDKLISNYENSIIFENKTESVHKSELLFYGKIALIVIFIIIFLSFVVTKFFASQNEKIESRLNYLIQEENLLNKLNKEKTKKEEILRISGFLNSDGVSYWTNEIVKDIPRSVVLSELEVFTIKQKIKKNKKIDINGNLIVVKGSSFDENGFNDWIKVLTQKEKIFKIDIINYTQRKDQEVKFELNIQLNR